MLEVVFNESASISLMMAQKYGKGPFPKNRGLPAFLSYGWEISSEEDMEEIRDNWLVEERENWEKAEPLGGNGSDIFCFDMLLNIGCIDESVFDKERQSVMQRFDYAGPDETESRLKKCQQGLTDFCLRVKDGEPVRIWHGQDTEDMCGMLWLCYEMVRRNLPLDKVNFVKLPDEILSTREIPEEKWYQYAGLQTLIAEEEIQFYASQWEALKAADAPLRVVVNDCVLSATEDFYDERIWQEIEKVETVFSQPKLIGRLLDTGIGIRDSWIRYRLDRFVATGMLEVVAVDHECSWIRMLRRKEKRDE